MTTTYVFSDSSDLQIEIIIVNIQFAINIYNLFSSYFKPQCSFFHKKKNPSWSVPSHKMAWLLPPSSAVYRKKPEKGNRFCEKDILIYKDLHKEEK